MLSLRLLVKSKGIEKNLDFPDFFQYFNIISIVKIKDINSFQLINRIIILMLHSKKNKCYLEDII